MADGGDLRSSQMSLVALRPRLAFGVAPSGIDKICRSYFFGLAPVPPIDHRATMLDLIGLVLQLPVEDLDKLDQLMLTIGTRSDCDEGVSVARNVVRQKP